MREQTLIFIGLLILTGMACSDEKDSDDKNGDTVLEDDEKKCRDGDDNDGDEKIDCDDDDCAAFCCDRFCDYEFDVPEEADPKAVGLAGAEFFDSQLSDTSDDMHYKTACTWYGGLQVAELLGEDDLLDSLIGKFDYYIEEGAFDDILEGFGSVDDNVFGIVPFEIYMLNGDDDVLAAGVALAEHQIENKDFKDHYRMAIDDMFMLPGLQVQAYRATGNEKYLDFAAERMVEYLDELQQDDGCFYQSTGANAKWGRGNGWFAAGMAETLLELDEDHEDYAAIFKGYQKMMAGLIDYQITEGEGAGLWKQVIDSDVEENWPETSGSAMFAFAMIVGVRNGWLDAETYASVALNAWTALVEYVDEEGRVTEISEFCYWKPQEGDALEYYVNRDRVVGDGHGQAPFLWAAAALLRPAE